MTLYIIIQFNSIASLTQHSPTVLSLLTHRQPHTPATNTNPAKTSNTIPMHSEYRAPPPRDRDGSSGASISNIPATVVTKKTNYRMKKGTVDLRVYP